MDIIGHYIDKDHSLPSKVLTDIDAYYSFETFTADGSFRVYDSHVKAGHQYDGHLAPNRVKMRQEVLLDLSVMSPYAVFTFTGIGLTLKEDYTVKP